MFEKSLFDLIRGLRNHKGNEQEYIQHSLRECRAEIRGPDMDLKATALLKLVYLEMFGHDMSWASFNVLEVMSSPKYLQKRVGYLGAVQSFRPDTEVLMLATNLLKKDINSSSIPTISLPLVTLPHVTTPSLAMSLLTDLLPRLSHSNPSVRKKTVVTLYRLALVYPETLRPSWPKIKEMLMDQHEHSCVTAAIVNVVCELGWRRPQDFLPLAPRLFDLLVDGGNNWMAIKIVKLFAILTPLEPRLIKKLLPPLTTLIRTTPAMSLLYECIDGIIQGGIFEAAHGDFEGDEIALLCVGKLRSMIVVEGDPNLKYVALVAFNKIVLTHPHLVSTQQDVIMGCIDDQDISIRLQALELGSGMINNETLVSVVDRLLKQLRAAHSQEGAERPSSKRESLGGTRLTAESDSEEPEEAFTHADSNTETSIPMHDEFRTTIIRQILNMCSRNAYANISDFGWYINILIDLAGLAPARNDFKGKGLPAHYFEDISWSIGVELRNVAVRVCSFRMEAVQAALALLGSSIDRSAAMANACIGEIAAHAAWIVGEYAELLPNRYDILTILMLTSVQFHSSNVLCAYLQAIPKIIVSIWCEEHQWTNQRQSIVSLLLARTIHFIDPLTNHPHLEVQERAVECLELMRLAAEAATSHRTWDQDGPLLLTQAIPRLFSGVELNPIAKTAQRKVNTPRDLDLAKPLNNNLMKLLQSTEAEISVDSVTRDATKFYHERSVATMKSRVIIETGPNYDRGMTSYQYDESQLLEHKSDGLDRAHRDPNKDNTFYIADRDGSSSGIDKHPHDTMRPGNGYYLDLESIPIMDLAVGERSMQTDLDHDQSRRKLKVPQKAFVAADETIEDENNWTKSDVALVGEENEYAFKIRCDREKRSLLEVDSSGIGVLTLDADDRGHSHGGNVAGRNDIEDAEMAKALFEVERLRMEMQRATERTVVAEEIPRDGALVKQKRKKVKIGFADRQDLSSDLTPLAMNAGHKIMPRKKSKETKKKKIAIDQTATISTSC